MKPSIFSKITDSLLAVKDWYFDTPERALEQAYNAALRIKAIEDEYFDGKKISPNVADYGDSVMTYFESELNQNLSTAKNRLREFKASNSFLQLIADQKTAKARTVEPSSNTSLTPRDRPSVILEKLRFIDNVISKYKLQQKPYPSPPSTSLIVVSQQNLKDEATQIEVNNANPVSTYSSPEENQEKTDNIVDKTGILPRSIFRTINKIQRELDPQSEQDIIKKYRTSKAKTAISLRFILTLIIAPLLSFQLCKIAVVGPIVDKFIDEEKIDVFINRDLEDDALIELNRYEQKLKFNNLITGAPKLTPEQVQEKLQERANEIAEEALEASANAIKNVFCDLISLFVFVLVIVNSRREISTLKSFMDEVVYGLSDSAKAFIIILFTDIFVGYHSPHGWEVLLEGVARHLGLPESRNFIFLFIATFPVVLDTVFKYWIFRYLNRISPSAVATYRNMNE